MTLITLEFLISESVLLSKYFTRLYRYIIIYNLCYKYLYTFVIFIISHKDKNPSMPNIDYIYHLIHQLLHACKHIYILVIFYACNPIYIMVIFYPLWRYKPWSVWYYIIISSYVYQLSLKISKCFIPKYSYIIPSGNNAIVVFLFYHFT